MLNNNDHLWSGDEGDGETFRAKPACSANSVEILITLRRKRNICMESNMRFGDRSLEGRKKKRIGRNEITKEKMEGSNIGRKAGEKKIKRG